MTKPKKKRVVLGEGYPTFLVRWIDGQRLIGLDVINGRKAPMKHISERKKIRLIAEVLE